MSQPVYLYGFLPPGAPAPPADLAGVDGQAVEILPLDRLDAAAAVSRMSSEWGDAEVLDARLKDMGWVGEQGLLHESVVAWFVDRGDILPAAFLTVFSSETALLQQTEAGAEEIRRRLERLRGLREWDLKVSYIAQRLAEHLGEESEEVAGIEEEIREAAPGRRYLLERKKAERVKALTGTVARDIAGRLLDELRPLARETRLLPLPGGGEGVPVILNAALLVDREGEAALGAAAQRRVAELEAKGVRVHFSGPWAPYRFLEEM